MQQGLMSSSKHQTGIGYDYRSLTHYEHFLESFCVLKNTEMCKFQMTVLYTLCSKVKSLISYLAET